ncbi:peptidoglycan DD-metalloendopeptidase family protein [Marinospirillum sp.]|uniref:peptidoglycan DD-metalloendopeptidase family protein n=1 Tax=Marinospirillum sp. TaxID=2183934 RepID=UPI00287035ED|nr:peptidoglycan DD-metalloendopeptidase family protein [Marinospirillum sp.]MDR9467782.1 peptidoglycan DD-metalloendopeptidase family protein [Marinospirillum sp.]
MSRYSWQILGLSLLLLASGCSSPPKLDVPPPSDFEPFYRLSQDETLADAARQLEIDRETLERFNPRFQGNRSSSRRTLRVPERDSDVPPEGPYYYRIQAGDTLSKLAQHFHISLLSLIQANPGIQPQSLRIGQRIIIPVKGRDTHDYRWPVANPQVRINFSYQRWGVHQGLTLETQSREEIFPIAPGQVVFAGEMRGFGRVVIVEHSKKHQSIYAYCHALFVEERNRLSGRHPVCSAGNQRQIDKPGIYFELREEGRAVSPENYLPALPWK